MQNKTALSLLLAITLASGGTAYAQGYGNREDRGQDERTQRVDREDHRGEQGRDWDHRDGRQRGYEDGRRDERGAGPHHDFRRGERLPDEYRHRQYVVDDWRGHRLDAPPRGYHWVQTGADYVLVAIATGVILQLVFGR